MSEIEAYEVQKHQKKTNGAEWHVKKKTPNTEAIKTTEVLSGKRQDSDIKFYVWGEFNNEHIEKCVEDAKRSDAEYVFHGYSTAKTQRPFPYSIAIWSSQ